LFPFGHGLSYTAFKYSKLMVPAKAKAGRDVVVKLTVTNMGAIRGQEVVQLYVGDKIASVARPEKELKGFVKVDLKPGQSKEVQFKLDSRAFAFYDVLQKDWVVEPGEFEILAASSSKDIRAKAVLVLEK
jgi:beta-glucosidase